jgi:hypothetical protein
VPQNLYQCCAVTASAPKDDEIERTFYRALALAPRNLSVVSNLDTYYGFLDATDAYQALISPDELKTRWSTIDALRSYLERAFSLFVGRENTYRGQSLG